MSGRQHSTSRRGALRAMVVLFVLSSGMGGTRAWADGRLDFVLKNRLGVTIRSVYVSPHQERNWEEDVLGTGTLDDGQDSRIRFNSNEEARGDLWDLKVVTSNNDSYVWTSPGFNLTKISEITIFLRGGEATATSR
jgi:hypothetical protein